MVFDYITYVRVKKKKNSYIVNTSYGYQVLMNKINPINDENHKATILGRLEFYFKFNDFFSMEEIELDNVDIIEEEKEYISTLNKIYDMLYVVKDPSKYKDLSDKGIQVLSLNNFNKLINAEDNFQEWLTEEFSD